MFRNLCLGLLAFSLLAGCAHFESQQVAPEPLPEARIAIVGGTFINDELLLREGLLSEPYLYETKLGKRTDIQYGTANGVPFYYVHRHGLPDMQNAWVALYELGVTDVIGGATAGAINPDMKTYDFVIPHDFIDMNVDRPIYFPREIYRDPDVIPIPRYTPAMDTDMLDILKSHTDEILYADPGNTGITLHEEGVIVQARGGRFETVSEISMFAQWGGDVVTMNVPTEIAYARMLGINYAALIVISNPAEGVAAWDFAEMPPLYRKINPLSADIILTSLPDIAALEGKPRVSDGLLNHPEMTSQGETEE